MRYFVMCISLWYLVACVPKEERWLEGADLPIRFSIDTLRFDTLFSEEPSIFQRFVIFNTSDKAFNIDRLELRSANHDLKATVQGIQNTLFEDIYLRGKDSLLVLVQITPGKTGRNSPVLQSANFIVARGQAQLTLPIVFSTRDIQKLTRVHITENTTWQDTSVFLIKDTLTVLKGATLTVRKGVHLYIQGGTLQVYGTLLLEGDTGKTNTILLEGARTDEAFREVPGQWNGIVVRPGGTLHLSHVELRNALVGIQALGDSISYATVHIGQSYIHNCSIHLLEALHAEVKVYNSILALSAFEMVHLSGKGTYAFYHNTLDNTQRQYIRDVPGVRILGSSPETKVDWRNNIVWGFLDDEWEMDSEITPSYFSGNVIRSSTILDTLNTWSSEPDFVKFQEKGFPPFIPDSSSVWLDKALPLSDFKTDYFENMRDTLRSDAGAIEVKKASVSHPR